MPDIARLRRGAVRFAQIPYHFLHVNHEVAILRQEVGALRTEIGSLQATLDFAAASILDTLALTDRSIEGLSARLDKFEKRSGQGAP
jgi:hypothetical protein